VFLFSCEWFNVFLCNFCGVEEDVWLECRSGDVATVVSE